MKQYKAVAAVEGVEVLVPETDDNGEKLQPAQPWFDPDTRMRRLAFRLPQQPRGARPVIDTTAEVVS